MIESTVPDPLDDGRTRYVAFETPNYSPQASGSIGWLDSGDPATLVISANDSGDVTGGNGHLVGKTQSAKAWLDLGDQSDFWEESNEWPKGCNVGG